MNSYACYHKPTKTWVYFKNNKKEESLICLCLKVDATAFSTKEEAEDTLKRSSFNDIPNYGFDNFLEFEVKKYE